MNHERIFIEEIANCEKSGGTTRTCRSHMAQFSLVLLVLFISFENAIAARTALHCRQLFSDKQNLQRTSESQFKLTGQERSFRDLEPVFRKLVGGEPFELIVPRGYVFNLTPGVQSVRVRHAEKDVDYYPYYLRSAATVYEKYYHDLLGRFSDELNQIQHLQQTHQPIEWLDFLGMEYRFNPSPSTGISSRFFGQPERVETLVDTVRKIGRPPFIFKKGLGDWHITNEHFLRHVKKRNIPSIILYRAHNEFDIFYYRLLLSKKREALKRRTEFAEWLKRQQLSSFRQPNDRVWWKEIISRLEDQSQPLDPILLMIAQKATTSVMFTSLTDAHSSYWLSPNQVSEIMKLKLNLDKLSDEYLEQIFVGRDLDIEIAFPFTTLAHLEAMRTALTVSSQ